MVLKRFLSYFPTKVPTGKTEYQAWNDSIIELTGPLADKDSLTWVIASEVMHLPAGTDKVAKNYFVRRIKKGALTQVASQIMLDIKLKQQEKAAQEAAALKEANDKKAAEETAAAYVPPTPAEATAPPAAVASDGQKS